MTDLKATPGGQKHNTFFESCLCTDSEIDEHGKWVPADVAVGLYEALASIENDDGRIPQAIWDMRNAALAKARGEV